MTYYQYSNRVQKHFLFFKDSLKEASMKILNDKTYNWLIFNARKIINLAYVIVAIVFNIYMYDYYNESFVNYLQVFVASMLIFWLSLIGIVFINILLLPLDKWGIVQNLRGRVTLAETEDYTLYYYPGAKLYHAGCRVLKAKQAREHYLHILRKPIDTVAHNRRERAMLFLAAINENEESS
jgi:hypothetical protein